MHFKEKNNENDKQCENFEFGPGRKNNLSRSESLIHNHGYKFRYLISSFNNLSPILSLIL